MNHPCEKANFFNETVGRYRYRHTLMAIGRAFKDTAKNVAKTAAEKAAENSRGKSGTESW